MASSFVVALLLVASFLFVFSVHPARAQGGTIYIRPDGSVDPPTAPISNFGNVTYTVTGNISDSVVVQRDNIVVDGAGYWIQGAWIPDSPGVDLFWQKQRYG